MKSNLQKFLILILVLLGCQNVTANWTKQNSGTLAWLYSIYFVDQNKGWIVGSLGTFLTTTDGGKTWRQEKKFTLDKIRDVYFSDAQTGWLLCEQDVHSVSSSSSPSYLLKTSDNGANWEKINFPESKEKIARIFFAPGGKGFAVGESGAFWVMQEDQKIWKRSVLPVRFLMRAGKFTDNSHGFLVGGGGTILLTEDNGFNWNHALLFDESKAKLNSIFFINSKTGWTVGDKGKIYVTNDGGKVWKTQNSGVEENILDIFFVNASEGFAVGDNGTILQTTNAGVVWNQESFNFKTKLEKLFFIDQKGFAVGFGGTILTYNVAKTR